MVNLESTQTWDSVDPGGLNYPRATLSFRCNAQRGAVAMERLHVISPLHCDLHRKKIKIGLIRTYLTFTAVLYY